MAKTPSAPVAAPAVFERHDLTDRQLREIMRLMMIQRTIGNRGFQLNRQGKIPFAAGSDGHEAVQIGAAMALVHGKDILSPYYRDIGLAIGGGLTTLETLLSLFARSGDLSGGRQFPNHYTKHAADVHSISSIIAAHCPHAVGAAYALVYRKERGRAVLCSFGDGATSEGEWHESVNFAAIHKLPIVFLCQNNGLAISVPLNQQMAQPDIYKRADGYGLPGVLVDGMDPIAVYGVVKTALDRAREGGGPTLIEAKCYRYLSHTTDDDDRTYRTREEIEAHRPEDPVPRFQRALVENNIMSAEELEQLKADVLAEVNDVTDRAEAMEPPPPSELWTHVYEGTHEPWL
ncbi:MAG TPA: thiamine pyrophosphate-dependent dehydrogenase E1 component subunit alpha [Candidatus Baltobacteraceae bacterium]|nr:thiamine pyrophosphate-dependent dehydrogenase E1 component subunit alpha [Candidatus Baltobacteraceae bacterium]